MNVDEMLQLRLSHVHILNETPQPLTNVIVNAYCLLARIALSPQ